MSRSEVARLTTSLPRRQQEAAVALALASEQARRGVMVTLVGDVATSYFLLRELDVQLVIARQEPDPVAALDAARRAAARANDAEALAAWDRSGDGR